MKLTRAEQQAWQEYIDLCERIKAQTGNLPKETHRQRETRKDKLRQDFVAFCKYYLEQYMDADFAWFHRKAAKAIAKDPNIFLIDEWPREHAKSVFAVVMIPMWLYARGEMTGMVVYGQNEDKAKTLLSDFQAQISSNQRWIADYGELATLGDWRDGKFTTTDGIGFWAFGRNQSPRGIRKAQLRPNYAAIDDVDDPIIVRSQKRVEEVVERIMEELVGALSIKGGRVVVSGNRIHPQSILAHLVGDIDHDTPKRKGITHIKVYAIEDKRHNKADFDNGRPAWNRYTMAELKRKADLMGFASWRREFFHEHHEKGFVFQQEWIQWRKARPLKAYDALEVYCDPSFKDTKKSDYKAIVLLGKKGIHIDIIRAWVRQASTAAMVGVFYDWYKDKLGEHARYRMEANFLQDIILDDFRAEDERQGFNLPIRPDKRSKPNKEMRIENISPLFERGLVYFNSQYRSTPDMQTLVQQFLGFPFGKDDGPDAVEGGIFYLQGSSRSSGSGLLRSGSYRKNRNR